MPKTYAIWDRHEAPHRTRRATRRGVLLLLTAVALVGVATTATALGLKPGAVHNHSTTSTTLATGNQWTIPENQNNDPDVPTPGGAVEGQGNINAISCVAGSLCFGVGADDSLEGVIATSSDGGKSWTNDEVEGGLPYLNSISCADAQDCVAVGDGVSLSTTDGGNSWSTSALATTNTSLLGVSCSSASTCVGVGVTPGDAGPYGGQILLTTNAGSTWSTPNSPAVVSALGGVACPSSTFCVAVGQQILVSNDGGQSWSLSFVDGGTGVLRTVSCASASVCVAIGVNPVGLSEGEGADEVVTTDGGVTWSTVTTPSSSALANLISCTQGLACLMSSPATGDTPASNWTSSDGGETWTAAALPGGFTVISAANCQSSTSCVLAGRNQSGPVTESYQGGSNGTVNSVGAPFTNSEGS